MLVSDSKPPVLQKADVLECNGVEGGLLLLLLLLLLPILMPQMIVYGEI
jgi:hypothetical protein